MPSKDPLKLELQRVRRNAAKREKRRVLGWVDGRGRHRNGPKGSAHHRWNLGRMIGSDGYILVRVGRKHPLADPNGYCREHVLIMCAAIGRPLNNGEVVHHRNGERTDNRLENLELMTRAAHNVHHNTKRAGNVIDGERIEQMPERGMVS